MSLVATLTNKSRVQDRVGDKSICRGTFAFDNLYQTNGMTVNLAQMGLEVVNQMHVLPNAGYVFQYVAATGKVKAFWSAVVAGNNAAQVLAEVTVNTDLSALTAVGFEAWGTPS